jgi:hypothetical protein
MHKLNIPTNQGAKIVNNLLTASSLNSDNLSTHQPHSSNTCIGYGAQTGLTNNSLPYQSTNLCTYLNKKSTLLNTSFTHYPQPLLMSPSKEI